MDEENEEALLPQQIGPYHTESLLAKGKLSEVYLAVDPNTQKPLVVKTLAEKCLSREDMVDRFFQEARIIAMSHHPSIVKLYGYGRWDKGVYIAMEFVRGMTLREFLLQQGMSLERALQVTLQIGYALTHLHAYGVIHGDLKPDNILLTAEGGIKVTD
ncbi:serine/threonine protein kinase, partial [Simkania negevensis]|nr:serine/threonine protein kinase [Simkania negevensis]